MARTGKKCYTALMSKPILRWVLTSAAVVLVLNLLLFTYARFVVLPLLGALFLLALCVGLGDAFAAAFKVQCPTIMETTALGLMAVTAFFFLAGSARILNRWSVFLFLAISLAITGLRCLSRPSGREFRAKWQAFLSRPISAFAVFLLPMAYAALPPTFYDTLVYHLGIANLYLQNGGFVPTPQLVFANTFIYYEISLIPAVFIGDMVPRLFHFLLGALFLTAVADEAAENWGIKNTSRLVLALASLPMTLFLLVTCKNDLPGAVFIFLAIIRFRRGDWKLSAVFWGFAVGIKYSNLLPLAVFALVAFKPWKRVDFKRLVLTGLIVLLAVSPLLLKNLVLNSNPFSPFLADRFPSPCWDSGRLAYLQRDVGRICHSWQQFLKFPYEASFAEIGSGGIVGPLFLIFLPFLLLGPRLDRRWLIFSLLVLAATPFLSGSLRFAYVAFVVLAIYCLVALEASAGKVMKSVFAVVIAVNLFMGAALLERVYAAHLLWSGKASPEEYKAERFPAYPLFAHINANLPKTARIIVAGEARNFYLKRPYQASSALDYGILKKYLTPEINAPLFIAALKRDGFSHLAIDYLEQQRLQKGYANYSSGEWQRLQQVLSGWEPEFRLGPLCLYKLD